MHLLCNYCLFSCPRKQIIKTDFVVFSGTFLIRKCIIYSVHKINLALKLISSALAVEAGYLMVFALFRAQDPVKAGPLFSVRVHILPALQCWWMLLG